MPSIFRGRRRLDQVIAELVDTACPIWGCRSCGRTVVQLTTDPAGLSCHGEPMIEVDPVSRELTCSTTRDLTAEIWRAAPDARPTATPQQWITMQGVVRA